MLPIKRKLQRRIRLAKRLKEIGKIQLRPGFKSEHNVLYKGFPRTRKVERIIRFSRLTIM